MLAASADATTETVSSYARGEAALGMMVPNYAASVNVAVDRLYLDTVVTGLAGLQRIFRVVLLRLMAIMFSVAFGHG